MSLLHWLGLTPASDPAPEDDGLADIERKLEGFGHDRARYLAGFAYLLGRVARADHQVSDSERRLAEHLVQERGGLTAEQATLVVQLATAHGLRFGATEDFAVTRMFGGLASPDEKRALLDCLFGVSAADASILTSEDNEIRRIAMELNLGHDVFVEARARHVAHLEVLRHRLRG